MKRSRKSSAAVPEDASKLGTLVQVARLYHEEGLSQQEVADRLGVSRSLIALYLNNAREAGIVIDRLTECAKQPRVFPLRGQVANHVAALALLNTFVFYKAFHNREIYKLRFGHIEAYN